MHLWFPVRFKEKDVASIRLECSLLHIFLPYQRVIPFHSLRRFNLSLLELIHFFLNWTFRLVVLGEGNVNNVSPLFNIDLILFCLQLLPNFLYKVNLVATTSSPQKIIPIGCRNWETSIYFFFHFLLHWFFWLIIYFRTSLWMIGEN